jgi:thymidylate synthase (FAD)
VRLIAWTHFQPPDDVPWTTDADGGQALAEFAGRACYQAWDKSKPATATNAGYLRHILHVGHLSVIEHASATFYLTGISSSVAHELIRHRHFSYSQLSPRYLPEGEGVIEPDLIAADPDLHAMFADATRASSEAYHRLVEALDARLDAMPQATLLRKQARQAARAVLPNASETRIVVTGNYRAWRHFIAMRGGEHVDTEIRGIAVDCLRHLQTIAPNVFNDFAISTLADGTRIAASPLVAEG